MLSSSRTKEDSCENDCRYGTVLPGGAVLTELDDDEFYVPSYPCPGCGTTLAGRWGEYAVIDEATDTDAATVAELKADGYFPVDAFRAWCAGTGEEFSSDNAATFLDVYAGDFDTFREHADELADDVLSADGIYAGSTAFDYFDRDAWVRDLLIGDYWTEDIETGGVYVFRNY